MTSGKSRPLEATEVDIKMAAAYFLNSKYVLDLVFWSIFPWSLYAGV